MEKIKITARDYDEAVTKALIELATGSDNLDIEVVDKGSKGFLGIGSRPCVIYVSKKQDKDLLLYEEDKDFKTDYSQNIFENKEKSNKENKYKVQTKSFDTEKSKPVEKVRDEGFVHETDSVKLPRKQRKVYSEEEAEAIIEDMRDFISKLFEKMEINVNMDTEFNHRDNEISVFFSSDDDIGLIIGKRGQTLDAIQYIVSLVVNKNTESYIRIKMDTENYRERRKENLEVLAKNVASKVKKFKKPISLEPMNPYERRIIHSVLQSDNFVSTRSDGDEPFRYITVIPRYNKRNNYKRHNNNFNK
jgi:SpoIIIJ-associated protein